VNEQTDSQLLRAFAERNSDPAFAELVRRHIDLVHSAALRMVCDAHLAQDVTQAVFIALAKNAAQFTERPILSGWLHRTAQNIAAQTVRTDVRRRAREQEAAAMNELLSATPDVSWDQIAPHLDTALGELDESERDALLFRYFERKSAREMAAQLGISDEAAQKRVTRAVERLRELFAKRGIAVGASGLVVAVSANAVQAAPMGLALTISTAAVLTGTNLATAATVTATKAIAMTTIQKTIIAAVVVASIATPSIIQHRGQSTLRQENESLRHQLEQHVELAKENERLSNELARARNASSISAGQLEDLLRLRAEVKRLKADSLEQARLNTDRDQNPNDPVTVEIRSWLGRMNQLKLRMDQFPGQKVPEMQLLTHNDWVSAARSPLETEEDFRRAMSSLRARAAQVAADLLAPALKQYLNEHNSEFPTDLTQLQPYFKPAIDTAVLQNFAIKPASAMPRSNLGGDWIIMTKEPVDLEYDIASGIGPNGSGAAPFKAIQTLQEREELNAALKALDSAKIAFTAANSGKQPTHPLELGPYVRTAEEQTAFEKIRAFQEAKEKAAREKITR
jgi:RNA polymerase sigma factor (sigma-70 family)